MGHYLDNLSDSWLEKKKEYNWELLKVQLKAVHLVNSSARYWAGMKVH